MADVAVHDAKKEGERRHGKKGRIDLSVSRHTVRVHEFLEGVGILVGHEMGGLLGPPTTHNVHHRSGAALDGAVGSEDGRSDFPYTVGHDPRLAADDVTHIVLEEIERVIDGLLATHRPQPPLNILRGVDAQGKASLRVLIQHALGVDHLSVVGLLPPLEDVGSIQVESCEASHIERITDALELLLHHGGLEQHHEDGRGTGPSRSRG